jgi:hypothetical protein
MKTAWTHGDKPTATLLNEYRTALIEAHDGLGDLAGWSIAQIATSESRYVLLHTDRYLHFVSNGQISDLAGTVATIDDINEDDTGQGVLDLDTLDWLVYGELYLVTGVTVCVEDWAA